MLKNWKPSKERFCSRCPDTALKSRRQSWKKPLGLITRVKSFQNLKSLAMLLWKKGWHGEAWKPQNSDQKIVLSKFSFWYALKVGKCSLMMRAFTAHQSMIGKKKLNSPRKHESLTTAFILLVELPRTVCRVSEPFNFYNHPPAHPSSRRSFLPFFPSDHPTLQLLTFLKGSFDKNSIAQTSYFG